MRNRWAPVAVIAALAAAAWLLQGGASAGVERERLLHHRNLGKAFYENPVTQLQAVDEFRKALELAPDSARERVNYGLALLRAGKTEEGVAELEKVQKQDPRIPHTWFNLGIVHKKDSQYERAIPQFEQMIKLVPDEAVSHYNLGVLYKLTSKAEAAVRHFEISARLDPNLAGPHFQLYNAYRQAGRAVDAAGEEKIFQELKKRKAGAAIPEDLDWSYYVEIYETVEPEDARDAQPAAVKFRAQKLGAGVDPASARLLAADVEADGRPDVIAWSSAGIQIFKNAAPGAAPNGLDALKDVLSIAPGDFNNDGLVDLAVITKAGPALFVNRKGTFEKHAATLSQGSFSKAVWLDYDHDYDLDLFLLGRSSALWRNNGASGFSEQTSSFPFVRGQAVDATLFDLVADTDKMDLAVVYSDRAGVLYRDRLGGRYEATEQAELPSGAKALAAYDFNNDGWTDLAVATGSGVATVLNRAGKLQKVATLEVDAASLAFVDLENRGLGDLAAGGAIFRNEGLAKFTPSKAEGAGSAAAVTSADFDGDGRMDLAVVDRDGAVELLQNQTETRNGWLRAGLLGVKNLRVPYGAEVELKAGTLYQKQTYKGIPLHFGLRSFKEVDTVRITWPNGMIQNQVKEAAGRAVAYKEAPRLSGSCPMIFPWNGNSFEFLTDVLGVAPLGASAGGGNYFPVDHDEYVQFPGDLLALRDGQYEIRITEELREVSYLDQVRLIAVDHPAGVDIFTNDKFKAPAFPEFRLFGVNRRVYPKTARDHNGRDVLSRVVRRDRAYVDTFSRDHSGIAEMHHLDLDFADAAADNRAVLILSGWVDWADGSTFVASSQEKAGGLVMPYLQVKDNAGRWQTVIEDMGIPAGKPKTIAVDLTEKFLSKSRQVRIVTDLCLYWDEIFLSENPDRPRVVMNSMEPASGQLRFRGFSRPVIHPERRQPEHFLYQQVLLTVPWNPTPGRYTRYGDVRPLLSDIDDRMVIMGSGDELQLRFDPRGLPLLPGGWKRDFLLFVDGWAKDADANTAFARSVGPLPFHGMSAYPYQRPEAFPFGAAHRKYQEEYNTRPALELLRPLRNDRRM